MSESRRHPPTCDLRVSDVLDAQAECRVTEIRSVAPALVLIAEIDAPLRLDVLADPSEVEILREHLDRDDRLRLLMDVYRADRDDSVFGREDRHADRLDQGRTLSSLRSP